MTRKSLFPARNEYTLYVGIEEIHLTQRPCKQKQKLRNGLGPLRIHGSIEVCSLQTNTVKQPNIKKYFSLILCNAEVVLGTFKLQTGHVCRGQSPISPDACRAAQSNHSSLTLNVIPLSTSGRLSPLKFHYSFHLDALPLHLPASVVSKGFLTQQSDIKWRGVSQMSCGLWLFGRPVWFVWEVESLNESTHTLGLNETVVKIAVDVMIVFKLYPLSDFWPEYFKSD